MWNVYMELDMVLNWVWRFLNMKKKIGIEIARF
jgi:hypothetical protein